jgi:hypothetical protein
VDYMPISSSGIPQLPPSNGTLTPAPSSDPVPPMGGFPACGCTRETFGCSTHPNMPETWIASMRGSLARILAPREKELESPESGLDFTARSSGQLELFALPGSCSKTPPSSAPVADTSLLPTWWRSDIPGATESCPRLMLEPRINGIGGGAWPTPSANKQTASGELLNADGSPWDGISKPHSAKTGKPVQTALLDALRMWPTPTTQDNSQIKGKDKRGTTLGGAARMWPTPTCFDSSSDTNPEFWAARRERAIAKHGTKGAMGQPLRIAAQFPSPPARDYRSGKGRQPDNGHTPQLPEVIGGTLNPTWVAWLMGWPLEATKLEPSEMAKFRFARPRPGKSSAGHNS